MTSSHGRPTSRPKQLQDGLGFFRTALLVFAFVALFVGAFIIFNTFSIIVAQRTRELALLRALGASRRQVLTSVVGRGVRRRLVASAVGIVVGIGIAIGLQGAARRRRASTCPSTATPAPAAHDRRVARRRDARHRRRRRSCPRAAPPGSRRSRRCASRQAPARALAAAGWSSAARRDRGSASPRSLYGLFGTPSNAAALVGLGAALTFLGVAILLAADRAPARRRARRCRSPHWGPGQARPRERDAEPAPDGLDGLGADDRSRAGAWSSILSRVAQGVVDASARSER